MAGPGMMGMHIADPLRFGRPIWAIGFLLVRAFRFLIHHCPPSDIAESHALCLTQRNGLSTVMTANSIGPPQIWDKFENFRAFIVLEIHE
jgi:hypothetical protein